MIEKVLSFKGQFEEANEKADPQQAAAAVNGFMGWVRGDKRMREMFLGEEESETRNAPFEAIEDKLKKEISQKIIDIRNSMEVLEEKRKNPEEKKKNAGN